MNSIKKLFGITLLFSFCLLHVSCKSVHVFTCEEITGDYEGYYTDNDSLDWTIKLIIYIDKCKPTSFGSSLVGRQRNYKTRIGTELEGTTGDINMLYGAGKNTITVNCISNLGKYNAKGNIAFVRDSKDTPAVCINLKVENPGYFKPGTIIFKKISD